jgi:hypothetical protein
VAGAVSFAMDTSALYVTTTAGQIVAVPKTGGVPVTLASGQSVPGAIAADAEAIYWANFGTLPNLDGSIQKLAR